MYGVLFHLTGGSSQATELTTTAQFVLDCLVCKAVWNVKYIGQECCFHWRRDHHILFSCDSTMTISMFCISCRVTAKFLSIENDFWSWRNDFLGVKFTLFITAQYFWLGTFGQTCRLRQLKDYNICESNNGQNLHEIGLQFYVKHFYLNTLFSFKYALGNGKFSQYITWKLNIK